MEYKFSNLSLERLQGCHPKLVEFAKELIKISPHDFKIVEGVRSTETQKEYYSRGRTKFYMEWDKEKKNKLKPITTLDGVFKKSKHQMQRDGYSHAFDMCFVGKTQNEMYNIPKFYQLAKVARPLMAKYNITWGGDWVKFKDMPHWQIEIR